MSPQDIQASFEARQHAVSELRRLVEDAEGQEFTAEQEAEYTRQNEAIDALDERIQTGLKVLEREAKATEALDQFRAYGDLTSVPEQIAEEHGIEDETTLLRKLATGELRSFESMPSEKRDQTVGTDSQGGYTSTSTMYDQIIDLLAEESQVIAAGAQVIRTAGGEKLLVPTVSTNAAGAIVTETSAYNEADIAFSQIELDAYKYGNLIQVSDELISDSMFDIAEFVGRQGGQGVARALGADLTNGNGSSKPHGIAQAATSFGTTSGATAITAAELIEVWSTMPVPYNNSDAAWLMSPEAMKKIRSLVDSNGQYIWQPGLQAEIPANLLGHRVYIDGNMDAVTSGKRAVVFAHMPSFAVRLAGGLRVDRSDEYGFANGLVTFRFTIKGDSAALQSSAVGCLTQA